jgi:uncharacterized protein (DUF433 family)
VSSAQIGRWARYGYIRPSRSAARPHVYSFEDVAEAIIVHQLLERGLTGAEIRNTVNRTRLDWGDWPLANAPLVTSDSGGIPKVLLRDSGDFFDIGHSGSDQKWLDPRNLKEVVELLSRGGWVIRSHPNITHIEVDPDRLSGRPAIRGSRVPVALAAELGRDAAGVRTLHEGYDLTDDEIRDAVEWYDASSAYGLAA